MNGNLNVIDDGGESGGFKRHGGEQMSGVVEIAHVLGVHFQKRREIGHDVTDPALRVPVAHALLKAREEEVVVQFKQGFDVGKHLRDQFLTEHVVHSVLLVDPELEHLHKHSTPSIQHSAFHQSRNHPDPDPESDPGPNLILNPIGS